MSLLARFTLDSPVLRQSCREHPGARVVLIQETLPDDRSARLAFWSTTGDEAFEASMREDPSVAAFERLATTDRRTMYSIDIPELMRSQLTYGTLVGLDAVVVSAVGDADGWHLRVRFPGREALNRYHRVCRELDIPFTLTRLYEQTGGAADGTILTEPQRDALELALEMGYFEVPRRATAADLGDALDISRQAVSERLRRAMRAVAERALAEGV